jgi:hypothetical protein
LFCDVRHISRDRRIKALSRGFIRGVKCDVPHIFPGCVMEITKIVYDTPEKRGQFVSGRCYTYSIRKLEKVSKLERVKMTNRIYEKELSPTVVELMGYGSCEKCGGSPIATKVCVMCK